jgi:hypothetical protein
MDEKTLAALKASIEKWEKRAAGKDNKQHTGQYDCPLCKMFHSEFRKGEPSCVGCPVYEETKEKYCSGTPYYDYAGSRNVVHTKAELDFIKSLLPEEVSEVKQNDCCRKLVMSFDWRGNLL